MPYIVIVADEMADLMMTDEEGGRAAHHPPGPEVAGRGIHLILATQKPTVDVITGLIKSNLPARICFQVASRTDSRVVLDEMGADKLLGNGDMLFLQPGTSTIVRAQGTYVSDEEISRVVEYLESTTRRVRQRAGAAAESTDEAERRRPAAAAAGARRAVRAGRRDRHPRGPRQRVAAAAGAGHRLRPGRPADRLHGRGRHRREYNGSQPARCCSRRSSGPQMRGGAEEAEEAEA